MHLKKLQGLIKKISQNIRREQKTQGGFTLVELLTTIAVLAILLTIAVPSMSRMINDWQVNSAVSAFSGSLSLAKSNAIKTPYPVVMCASNDEDSCSAAADWTDGWVIFADTNANGTRDATEDIIASQSKFKGMIAPPTPNTVKTFTFMQNGLLRSGTGVIMFQGSNTSVQQRKVAIGTLGRAITCRQDDSKWSTNCV